LLVLLWDVIEDDDGVGDIVVPIAREWVKVVVLALREEEEEEDGLEFFSILFTHAAPQNWGEKCIAFSTGKTLSCCSVCLSVF